MVYEKAIAEVVVLNNKDIATRVISLSENTPVEDLIGNYSEQDIRDTINSPYFSNDDSFNRFMKFLQDALAGNAVSSVIARGMTIKEARDYVNEVHRRCQAEGLFSASELFSDDTEDDSFDTEW